MAELTSQNVGNRISMIEVRFNSLQMMAIERALGKAEGCYRVLQSWYQLQLCHHAELSRGRSVLLTFPARLGDRVRLHG